MSLPIGKLPGEFARRALRRGEGEIDDAPANRRGNAIPVTARRRGPQRQSVETLGAIAPIPAVERRAGQVQLAERAPHRQVRLLHEPDGLAPLRGRNADASSSESAAVRLFLSNRFSSTISATTCFSRVFSLRRSTTSV